jgi:hypothetical protein
MVMEALRVLVFGMLGIFFVMSVIMVAINVLCALGRKGEDS